MARPSPVRLVIALSVAAVLAIFLLYVSVAGGFSALAIVTIGFCLIAEPRREPEPALA